MHLNLKKSATRYEGSLIIIHLYDALNEKSECNTNIDIDMTVTDDNFPQHVITEATGQASQAGDLLQMEVCMMLDGIPETVLILVYLIQTCSNFFVNYIISLRFTFAQNMFELVLNIDVIQTLLNGDHFMIGY